MFLGTLLRANYQKSSLSIAWLLALAISTSAQPYGLDSRVPIGAFLNNVLPPAAPAPATGGWTTVEAFPNLTFDDPVFLTYEPLTNRLYVCERQGRVWHFVNSPAASTKTLFLDLTAQTQGWDDCGVLGIAFHPEFNLPGSTNRNFVYVYYQYSPAPTAGPNRPPQGTPGYNRLSRFTVNPATGTAGSELVLINQFDEGVWHNGGGIFFGADGFLYLSNGDEGAANDSYNNTQKINAGLFSGVIRIDVDQDPSRSHPIRRQPANGGTLPGGAGWVNSSTANYYIPNDNPWVNPNGSVLEEFWAIGLRSPHRMTLDPLTQRIWLGDVGQASWEEVDIIEKGGNYQWAYLEGLHSGPKTKPNPLIGTDKPPVHEYAHASGNNCVIGGYVYRGALHAADLGGKYIFGDNGSGRIWSLAYDGTNAATVTYLCNMPAGANYSGLSSFGVDQNNELYMCKMGRPSKIYKFGRTGPGVPEPPARLSQTGAFSSLASLTPASGIIPFNVNSPLWSDAAAKQRWIAVPNDGAPYSTNETIAFSPTNEWTFPAGSVFIKHFELPINETNAAVRKRLETRLLVRDTNGSVYGVTYKWRADNSDADLLTTSLNEAITITTATGLRTQVWYYPSRVDCITCHNPNARHVLGVKTHQLNGDFGYPGGITDNQLRTWNHLGLFDPPLNETNISTHLKAVAVTNQSAALEHRVRSYIDANCAHCHRPNGVQAYFDARFTTPLTGQGIINGQIGNDLGISGARVVAPMSLAQSIMHLRMNSLENLVKMPPLAKNVVDTEAVATLAAWINSLTPPNTPPSVALSSPKSRDSFSESAPMTLSATASDSDGTVANVEFFANGVKVGEDSSNPYSFVWTASVPGTYSLTAVATDDDGSNTVSAPVTILVNSLAPGSTNLLVMTNSFWKYLDDGSDQGTAWRGTNFNADAWASGPAQLGYGDGDEATVVNSGPANNYFITTYFRRSFPVLVAEALTNVALRLRRDDGVIVYLNGAEIYRNNMPTGAVIHTTLASTSATDDGNTWFSTNVAPARLVSGMNLLAAEIHQRATNSSDISFDLELAGVRGILVTNPPPLIVLSSPTNNAAFDAPAAVPLAASVTSNGWSISKVEFFNGTSAFGEATNSPYSITWSDVAAGSYALSARALYGSGAAVTSAVASISVIALVAASDSYEATEDLHLPLAAPGVLGNDSGRGTLTAVLLAAPAHGQLTLNPDGSFGYMPAANFNGTDSFTYKATNGSAESDATTVTISVIPVNDAPVAFLQNATTVEDTPLNLTLAGTDQEGSALSYLIVNGPGHGTLAGTPPNLTYTPSNNFSGNDGFVFKVSDGELESLTATVSITVSGSNDLPTVSSIADQTIDEDTSLELLPFSIGDVETASESLALTPSSSNPGLIPTSAIILGGSGANRTVTVSPAANEYGVATITLAVSDADGGSASSSFVVSVNAVNDPPVISMIADQPIDEDTSTTGVAFTVGDVETTASTLSLAAASSNPTLIPESNIVLAGEGTNRTVTITPALNQHGSAIVTLVVMDANGATASSSFSVVVNPINDPPLITSIGNQMIDEDTSTAALAFSISDVETDPDALILSRFSTNPALVPTNNIVVTGTGANRQVTVTPAANEFGVTSVQFMVTDADGAKATNEFTILVQPVNDAPTLDFVSDLELDENAGPQTVALSGIGAGQPNEAQSLNVTVLSSDPGLIPAPVVDYLSPSVAGSLSFTPATRASGTALLTVTVEDDGDTLRGGTNRFSRSFQVRVIPIPTLKIARSGSNVRISWPAAATGYQLYNHSDLSTGSAWSPVTNTPAVIGSDLVVELEANGAQAWFRLRKP
jgi:uncharacterized repeat protein (TIGR03806 family)